jgi:uncharacterized repeat protein (TIGR01451 family)
MTPALLILAVVAAFCALPLSANADAPDPMITLWSDLTEVEPGDKVAFTIEVTNRGDHATVDTVVTDVIPEYLDIVWHATTQGQIVVDGQTVRADIGTVGPQFVVRIYIYTQVREDVPQPHEMENVAVLTSPNAGERRSEPLLLRVPPAEMPLTGGAGSIWLVCSGGFVALLALALWEGSRDHPPEPSSL